MKKIFVSLILFVIFSPNLWSDDNLVLKGHHLSEFALEYTKDQNGLRHREDYSGMFLGYVVGVWHARGGGKMVEVSNEVTGTQICKVVAKYLENHPEEHHKSALSLIINAYNKAFGPKPLPQKFVTQ